MKKRGRPDDACQDKAGEREKSEVDRWCAVLILKGIDRAGLVQGVLILLVPICNA